MKLMVVFYRGAKERVGEVERLRFEVEVQSRIKFTPHLLTTLAVLIGGTETSLSLVTCLEHVPSWITYGREID